MWLDKLISKIVTKVKLKESGVPCIGQTHRFIWYSMDDYSVWFRKENGKLIPPDKEWNEFKTQSHWIEICKDCRFVGKKSNTPGL